MASSCELCCEIFIAILLPPVGVCLRHGCCTLKKLAQQSLKWKRKKKTLFFL
ncbi:Low temperature and salt responsive protein family [Arabidopsis thaliana]|uniref:Low temperature and salt responsive protein family n=1 Tax=Arabidopsis thaliana TaxID=3702 RepID=A0A1P8AY72_ARATH|nr:Low temperature and salt responsive protein family [Arabidopsis thaliana]ANM61595.1 Low temperature and salt responsive protein family [Arabidopsis thaliana]|eukprot:NP_001323801.1 Low temperature and salt responsive protein family [Arabidopsis thaliana]